MDDTLMHYGRKGMRWGVMNGPPYPIGAGLLRDTSLSDLQAALSRMRVESEYLRLATDINRMNRVNNMLTRAVSYGLEEVGKQASKWAIGSILNKVVGEEVVNLKGKKKKQDEDGKSDGDKEKEKKNKDQ